MRRPKWLPVPFFLLSFLAYVSWMSDGVPMITTTVWVLALVATLIIMLMELLAFPQRLGVGTLMFLAGLVIWFTMDYLSNWSAPIDGIHLKGYHTRLDLTDALLAKATFLHMFFFGMVVTGLVIPWGNTVARLMAAVMPQPENPRVLLWLTVGLFLFSLVPYVLFTNVPFYEAIWIDFTSFRSEEAAAIWTIGRSGRLASSFAAYTTFWLKLGTMAAIIACFYAIFMAKSAFDWIICGVVFLFALAEAFGSGTRGQVVSLALPLLALLFIRMQMVLDPLRAWIKHHRKKAFIVCAALAIPFFLLMQIQAYNRGGSIFEADWENTKLVDPRDNTGFSHSLMLIQLIPEQRAPFYDSAPGITWVTCIPRTIFEAVIAPIPRAIWPGKPIDQAANWANIIRGGTVDFRGRGAGLAQGMVGFWWLRYGWAGIVQGGLLIGFFFSVVDRGVWLSRYKAMALIPALGFGDFLFREMRGGLRWFALNEFLVGMVVLILLGLFIRKMPNPPAIRFSR
ncbi:MAG: hypothetical protein AAGI54_09275, partial [Planctomycetota bacterium]